MTPHSGPTMGHKTRIAGMLGVTGIRGAGPDRARQRQPQGQAWLSVRGACRARKTDGARFVKDAVARGAVAVLGAPALADEVAALGVRFIADENPRAGLAHLASLFFAGQPEIVAAVTGTKGKSSIVAFLREIWTALGKPAASLGTVGVIGPKGEMPLVAHHAGPGGDSRTAGAAEDRRRRSSGDRGFQPWPGSAPAGRREDFRLRVHQHHPRPYGLSSDLRGLPRRQAAAVHRSGEGWRRRGGQCRCRTCRPLHRRGEGARPEADHGRPQGRDHPS